MNSPWVPMDVMEPPLDVRSMHRTIEIDRPVVEIEVEWPLRISFPRAGKKVLKVI